MISFPNAAKPEIKNRTETMVIYLMFKGCLPPALLVPVNLSAGLNCDTGFSSRIVKPIMKLIIPPNQIALFTPICGINKKPHITQPIAAPKVLTL